MAPLYGQAGGGVDGWAFFSCLRVTISNPITEQACVLFDTYLFYFIKDVSLYIRYTVPFIFVCKLLSSLCFFVIKPRA